MRNQIYKLIQIAMIGTPEVKHFGLWNNQLLYIEDEQPFLCPAVFVEFLPIQWSLLGNCVREADVTIVLHIVSDSRTGAWEEATSVFDIINKITKKLHRMSKRSTDDSHGEIGSLVCVSSETDNDFGELMHNVETYKCHVKDFVAVQEMTKVNPSVVIVQ